MGYTAQLEAIRWLQEHVTWLEPVMLAFTRLGDEEFYVFAFPLLYWSVSRHLILIGIIFLLSDSVKAALKLAFASPRPFFLEPEVGRIAETSFGIPSGHAQNAAVVWPALAAEVRRTWAWAAAITLALLIGVSRFYLGVHFAEDLVAGWLLGALLVVGYLRWREPVSTWLSERAAVLQLGTALAVALSLVGLGAAFGGEVSEVVTPAATLFGLAVGLVALHRTGGWDSGGSVWRRLARFPVGLVGVVVIWMGLGAVFPGGEDPVALALRFVRYGLLGAWVAGGAPWLFVRLGLASRLPGNGSLPAGGDS